jgi:hypothetical protein
LIWLFFAFLAVFNPANWSWLLVIAVAVVLNMANVVGYTYDSRATDYLGNAKRMPRIRSIHSSLVKLNNLDLCKMQSQVSLVNEYKGCFPAMLLRLQIECKVLLYFKFNHLFQINFHLLSSQSLPFSLNQIFLADFHRGSRKQKTKKGSLLQLYCLLMHFFIVLLTSILSIYATPPPCTSQRTRREFRELVNPTGSLNSEGLGFVEGVNCLAKTAGTEEGTLWDDLVKAHYDTRRESHGYAVFMPWHRLFLVSAERAMSDCIGRPVSIPYWDSALDSQAPENSQIWYVCKNLTVQETIWR